MNFQINNCLDEDDYVRRGIYIKNAAYSIFLYYVGDYPHDKETNSIDPSKIACTCKIMQLYRFGITTDDGRACYKLNSLPMLVFTEEFDVITKANKIAQATVDKLNELIAENFLKYAPEDALD